MTSMAEKKGPQTTRAPRRTGVDPQGTRDARDDATIIQWLSKIDTDIVAGMKQPLTPQPGAEKPSEQPEREVAKGLSDFAKLLKQLLGDFGHVLSPFLDVFKMIFRAVPILGMSRFVAGGTAPPAGDTTQTELGTPSLKDAIKDLAKTIATPSPVRRRGEALAGTTAEREFSFEHLKQGFGEAPERFRGPKTSHQQAADLLAAALSRQTATAAAAVEAGGAGEAGAAAAGAAAAGVGATMATGGLALAAVVAAVAFTVLSIAVFKSAEQMSALNRQLAEFSPSMASVFGIARLREVQRGMQMGEATAGTAGFLEDAFQDLKDTLAPLSILLRNISNVIVGAAVTLLDVALKPLSFISDGVNKILEWLQISSKSEDALTLGQWMEDIRDDYDRSVDRKRFGPGFATSGGDF
jgi:hypothetical protein